MNPEDTCREKDDLCEPLVIWETTEGNNPKVLWSTEDMEGTHRINLINLVDKGSLTLKTLTGV